MIRSAGTLAIVTDTTAPDLRVVHRAPAHTPLPLGRSLRQVTEADLGTEADLADLIAKINREARRPRDPVTLRSLIDFLA